MTLSDMIPHYVRATPSLACEAMGRLVAHIAGKDIDKFNSAMACIARVAKREMEK